MAGARIQPLPLDDAEQQFIQFLIRGGVQEGFALFEVGEVARDQAADRIGQGVRQTDPRVNAPSDLFCLGDEFFVRSWSIVPASRYCRRIGRT